MSRVSTTAILIVVLSVGGCALGGGSGDFAEIPGLGSTRVDVPRPTGAASAACDDDPLPPAADAAIADRAIAMRVIGLFADRAALSDEALGTAIEQAVADAWGAPDEIPQNLLDLVVAEQDHARVWWRDLEADVVDGNDVYAETLAEWGEISVGAFEPTSITETWDGAEGPVIVEFDQNGARRFLAPAYLEDWIDPGILVGINDLIAGSGRRFELYKSFDQTAFLMALTDDERRALEARGWCFE